MRLKRRTLDAMFDIGYQVITTRLVKLRRLKEVTKVRAPRLAVAVCRTPTLDAEGCLPHRPWRLHWVPNSEPDHALAASP